MSATSDLDIRRLELVERYYNSLEDQLHDPDPQVDGYGKTEAVHSRAARRSRPRRSQPGAGRRPDGGMTPEI